MTDPDRFFNFPTPGAQEWWYFDAITDDGRDTLVIIWYCGLPFDPDYGRQTDRHLRDPSRYPSPRAVDHSAIGLSWYRDGKTLAYALNAHPAADFAQQAEPFAVAVAGSRVERNRSGYRLQVETPAVDGRHRLTAELTFQPAAATSPVEHDLGRPGNPHHWVLVAADCRVEGRIDLEGPRPQHLDFRGRGYHDHNAGAEEIASAIRQWHWGRVHHGPFTEIHYQAETRAGATSSLWITCRDGRPEQIREDLQESGPPARPSPFGLWSRASTELTANDGAHLNWTHQTCVDDGPFYRRWLDSYRVEGEDQDHQGLSEQLDPKRLHHPLIRWMIPYRLKRPGAH